MSKWDEERKQCEEWQLGEYDNPENGCPNCGRHRVCIANNGKHVCEKCNWIIEDEAYTPIKL